MSCGPEPTTFRILDRYAAWQLDLTASPEIALGDVIELAQLNPSAVDLGALAGAMPPPWFARGCGACDFYLACPPRVLGYAARLSDPAAPASDRCAPAAAADPASCMDWIAIAGAGCGIALIEPVAVAAARGRVAVLDLGRGELLIFSPRGERVIAAIATPARGPIAFAGTSIVVADREQLARYDAVTLERSDLPPAPGPIARMVSAGDALWALVETNDDFALYRLDADGWRAAPVSALLAVARPTSLATATTDAICIAVPRGENAPRHMCIDRCGRPVPEPPAVQGPRRKRTGNVTTTAAIDSGIARCSWHRVRIELELPDRTGVGVSVATSEEQTTPIADADWQRIDDVAAVTAPGGTIRTCDFLIDQPPGRYLQLRLDLRGDGFTTPRIHRMRIDFPRSTSALRLPGVFRDDRVAADFLDRFVANFDASIEDLDRVIARFPALIDPTSAPAEALAWLGSFLDIALDPAWSESTRRAILAQAPELYRRRGTPWALVRAIELATGSTPAIQELSGTAPFARTGAFRIGESRLFGRARARFRLGVSAIGRTPLRAYGDPDRDHVSAVGFRIAVQLPAGAASIEQLRRIVESQKPAHVAASVRTGSERALLGVASALGIDTLLSGLPAPRLGSNTRLRRATVLARSAARGGIELRPGVASAIGMQTVLA